MVKCEETRQSTSKRTHFTLSNSAINCFISILSGNASAAFARKPAPLCYPPPHAA